MLRFWVLVLGSGFRCWCWFVTNSEPRTTNQEPGTRTQHLEPSTWNRCILKSMCRNIKTLANFEPPATGDEIRASALQFVRKLSGMNKPSRANEEAFNRAVEDVTAAAERLIASISTSAPPRNREEEARKAQERARERFA